jgi:hypothetical protein
MAGISGLMKTRTQNGELIRTVYSHIVARSRHISGLSQLQQQQYGQGWRQLLRIEIKLMTDTSGPPGEGSKTQQPLHLPRSS